MFPDILLLGMPSRRVQKQKKATSPPVEPAHPQESIKPSLRICEVLLPGDVLPFRYWLSGVRDSAARARIVMRLDRISTTGNFGDHRERISGAVSELRMDYGPGYRVYYVKHGELLVLLAGGIKDSQQDDIESAVKLWEKVKDDVEGYSRDITP